MGQVSASVTIELPIARCYEYVKSSVTNEKYLNACRQVWRREYSGRITRDEPRRHLTIEEGAVSILRMLRPGTWRVTYSFNPVGDSKTEIRLLGDYGLALALLTFPTTRLQIQNELLHRVCELLALEAGAESWRTE